jgi:uncharacterized membrane protein YoaK (UPF0700 family)
MQAIWPWVFLVLTAVVRFFATKDKDNNTQWTAVIVSTIAFFLWVFVTGGTFAGIPLPSGAVTVPVMKGVSALYVFVVPYFYKGD